MIPRVESIIIVIMKENYKQSGISRGSDRRFRRSSRAARLRNNAAERLIYFLAAACTRLPVLNTIRR